MNLKSKLVLVISLLISLGVISIAARPQAPSRPVPKVDIKESLSGRNVVVQSGGRPPVITSVNGGWVPSVPDPDPDINESDNPLPGCCSSLSTSLWSRTRLGASTQPTTKATTRCGRRGPMTP